MEDRHLQRLLNIHLSADENLPWSVIRSISWLDVWTLKLYAMGIGFDSSVTSIWLSTSRFTLWLNWRLDSSQLDRFRCWILASLRSQRLNLISSCSRWPTALSRDYHVSGARIEECHPREETSEWRVHDDCFFRRRCISESTPERGSWG